MFQSIGYGAKTARSKLEPMTFERDDPKPNELVIEVLYAGVCHSDIHQVKNEWANTVYPCVPGHEIVGRVKQAGALQGRRSGRRRLHDRQLPPMRSLQRRRSELL